MKLGIVIRGAGFISPRIFINANKPQCFLMLCGIRSLINIHVDCYGSMSDWCGTGVVIFRRRSANTRVNNLKVIGSLITLRYNLSTAGGK